MQDSVILHVVASTVIHLEIFFGVPIGIGVNCRVDEPTNPLLFGENVGQTLVNMRQCISNLPILESDNFNFLLFTEFSNVFDSLLSDLVGTGALLEAFFGIVEQYRSC